MTLLPSYPGRDTLPTMPSIPEHLDPRVDLDRPIGPEVQQYLTTEAYLKTTDQPSTARDSVEGEGVADMEPLDRAMYELYTLGTQADLDSLSATRQDAHIASLEEIRAEIRAMVGTAEGQHSYQATGYCQRCAGELITGCRHAFSDTRFG